MDKISYTEINFNMILNLVFSLFLWVIFINIHSRRDSVKAKHRDTPNWIIIFTEILAYLITITPLVLFYLLLRYFLSIGGVY